MNASVHAQVAKAVRKGELVRPSFCSECGRDGRKILAHHDDYDNPLDVRWLCTFCHHRWHREHGPGAHRRVATINTRVEQEVFERLQEMATAESRTVGQQVRAILHQVVEAAA